VQDTKVHFHILFTELMQHKLSNTEDSSLCSFPPNVSEHWPYALL
uniref:Uncharacterized protein n=1 Tax=Laticauda laticaudata TaxID=8630 RepID=A0A8C5SPX9_LATLA